MKTKLLCLVLALPASGQEENPFVTGPPVSDFTEAGEPFASLVEHVIVPANVLDDWLGGHPMKEDASELRAVVQQWVYEGKAKLDHTSVTTGTSGLPSSNHSVLEQVYAAEYMPPDLGEWPMPTAFESRNIGYSFEGGATVEQGKPMLLAELEVVRMLPHLPFHPLVEKTRHPGDIFLPRFRSIRVSQTDAEREKTAPSDPFAEPDPFADRSSREARFSPGPVYLAARADDLLPADPGVLDGVPLHELLPAPRTQADSKQEISIADEASPLVGPDRPIRLIFFRGVTASIPAASHSGPGEESRISVRLVQVNHGVFSDWLQTVDLAAIQSAASGAVDEWRKAEKAEILGELSAMNRPGSVTDLRNVLEVIYPTEWVPGERTPAGGGKPSQREFATAAAFETRNAGFSARTQIVEDSARTLLKVKATHIVHGGNTVHHRIFRDGEWQVNATFPLFASRYLLSNLSVIPGQWMFAGSQAAIDSAGKFDPDHAVLVFVKVE